MNGNQLSKYEPPKGWKRVSLGYALESTQYGITTSSSEGRYRMFRMNNFVNGRMSPDNVISVDVSDEEAEQYILRKGDILFNRTNSYDLVGKTGIFDLDGVYIFASYLVRLNVDRQKAIPEFINYFLNSPATQTKLKVIATKGVSQANINPTNLQKDVTLLLPPLPEQRKIAAVLSTWDTAIDTTEKLIAAKEQLKKGLMQRLLTGKMRLREFRGEKWKKYEFSEMAAVVKDHYDPRKNTGKYRCIELEHIEQGTGFLLGYTYTDRQISIKNTFKAGHILFGKLRPYLRKYWLASFDGMCSSEIWVLQHQRKIVRNMFLFYLIQSSVFIQACAVTSGTKMPRADWAFVSEIPFQIPSLTNQQKIASVLSTCDQEIQLLKTQLDALKRQKKGLMQQLLTGRVRVKVEEEQNVIE